MNTLLSHSLCEYLRRHGYGDDVVAQLGVNMEDFKQTYNQIEKRIPGLTIDFDKLIENDPIENDHLISQGNLAILRLDDIYSEVICVSP